MFVLRRLLTAIPVLIVVVTFVFAIVRLTGDPATLIAGDLATPKEVAQVRANLGLDQPLPHQFSIWFGHLMKGDLGLSIQSKKPVGELIAGHLEPTLVLAVSSLLIAILVAVPLGVLAAWRHESWVDRASMLLAVTGFSVPTFVVAYLLILIFAVWTNTLPVQGYVTPFENPLSAARQMALPSVTLAFYYIALISRVARASVLNVMHGDFVQTARAKGATETSILWRHVLRNAAVPIVTVIGLSFTSLVTGVVICESVFNIPGLGRLTVDAILLRDFPLMQGIILFSACVYVGVNLLVDILYAIIDPRIRA